MIWRWIKWLPFYLIVYVAKYPASVIAILFFSTPDKLYLTHWHWLETIDNTLAGDSGWRAEHITGDPLSNWNRIKWLWRNGGNWFNYYTIGCVYKSLPRDDGYWYWRYTRNFGKKYLEILLGWNISGPQMMRCKYVLTARLRTI